MANDAMSKFKSTLNRGITTINVKTSSSLEKTKIRTHIESLNAEIQRTFFEIGEQTYAAWEQGTEGDFTEQLSAIREKKEEIERLTQQLTEIDRQNDVILGKAARNQAQELVCPSCGAVYDEPVNFCRKCGSRLQG